MSQPSPSRAVKCYSAKDGEFWRGQHAACGWTSKDLPFPTRAEAEHAVVLHEALCDEPHSGSNASP